MARSKSALKGAGAVALAAAISMSAMSLLRAGDQPGAATAGGKNDTPHSTNSSVIIDELPCLPNVNRPMGTNADVFNIKMGEAFKDDTKCIEVKVKALPAPGVMESYCLLNGGTDKGWWYQFGLGYNGAFYVAVTVFNNDLPATPPYNLPFKCQAGDTVDLKMSITNGHVMLEANDLDRDVMIEGLSLAGNRWAKGKVIQLQAVGDRFVGGDYNSTKVTAVFTEVYSVTPTASMPLRVLHDCPAVQHQAGRFLHEGGRDKARRLHRCRRQRDIQGRHRLDRRGAYHAEARF